MQLSRRLVFISLCAIISSICRPSAADNICKETVPTNRFVDGIPAYSQCSASTNSSVWSDNGVNTNITTTGSGWALTQLSGGYQCTEFVYRYLYFKWDVNYRASGNAKDWCDGTLPNTLKKSTTPAHGDVIVFAPGSCGADISTGHVAIVDSVDKNKSTVTIVEQNIAGRRSCAISTAKCFLHVTSNRGATSNPGAGGRGGAAGTAGAGTGGKRAVSSASGTNPSSVGVSGKGGSGSLTTASGQAGSGVVYFAGGNAAVVAGFSALSPNPDAGTEAGCTCNLPHSRRGQSDILALLVGLLLLATRRRSRR